jgi:hypothetical protein
VDGKGRRWAVGEDGERHNTIKTTITGFSRYLMNSISISLKITIHSCLGLPAENRIFKIIGIFIIHAYRELSPIAWILILENKYASGDLCQRNYFSVVAVPK